MEKKAFENVTFWGSICPSPLGAPEHSYFQKGKKQALHLVRPVLKMSLVFFLSSLEQLLVLLLESTRSSGWR